ncbi:MAG: hypothetical protein ACRCV9_17975 [Burkholderiaceae bacterium]
MCDPVTLLVGAGAAAGATAYSSRQAKKAMVGAPQGQQADPAAERQKAEAEATQRANAKIVEAQRRRRAGQGLLSLGVDDQSQLGVSDPSRRSVRGSQSSLLGMGAGGYNPAAAGAGVPGGYYGGGGGGGRSNTRQVLN